MLVGIQQDNPMFALLFGVDEVRQFIELDLPFYVLYSVGPVFLGETPLT